MKEACTVTLARELYQPNQSIGKTEIVADIFDRYYQRIYNYVRYRVGDPDEADEISSRIFEQVLKRIETYNPQRAPFEVWLFRVAHHAVTDYYRSKKRREWFSLESIADMASAVSNPEEAIVQNEEHNSLMNALASLGERERNIIAMKFAAGLKNREIAKLMKMSESNVGVVLYRSMRLLREMLKTEEEEHERA